MLLPVFSFNFLHTYLRKDQLKMRPSKLSCLYVLNGMWAFKVVLPH